MIDPADPAYWDTHPDPQAAVWSDPNWEEGIELCLNQILPYLPREGYVLDVGAGVGRLANPIAERTGLIVRAYEPSARMRDAATPHERVFWSESWPEGLSHAAYIVAVLQHLPYPEQRAVLAHTVERLVQDGTLIFQSVEGSADGPGSHHVTRPTLTEWCDSLRLRIVGFGQGVHSSWLWTIALKQ